VHPFLHTPFGDIPAYTAFISAGFLSAAALTWGRHRARGFSPDAIFTMTLVACITGLVGARVWYVLTHFSLYSGWLAGFPRGGMDTTAGFIAGCATVLLLVLYARPLLRPLGPVAGLVAVISTSLVAGLLAARITALHVHVLADPFDPGGGGLAFFGGFALATPSCALVARARGIPIPLAADAVTPGLLAACSLGRIGCFLNGCCVGVPARGVLCPGDRVPTQLIEAVFTALLAVVIVFLGREPRTGRTAAAAALAYSSVRFTLEFFREEPAFFAGLTASQLAAVAIAAPAAAWLSIRRPASRETPAAA
jgi:phosphatidylglycerol:prolipoprotein diacylglycerol transferase